jgi:thiol:disulfide interchange protein DsbD
MPTNLGQIATGLVLGGLLTLQALAAENILKPQEAFRYEATASSASEVTVRWEIEPGHYLYKERMGYASRTAELQLGDPKLPSGKPYEDEFFGRMEIYRNQVEVLIPINSRVPGMNSLVLELRSQGCADIGLCYPPQTWTTEVALPEMAAPEKMAKLLGSNRASLHNNEPLPPEVAFQPIVDAVDPFNLQITWAIADGYYLYRDSLLVTAQSDQVRMASARLPAGLTKWDEHFGDTQVFYGEAVMDIPVARSTPEATRVPLTIEYQGCKEDSICYPPQILQLDIDLPAASADDDLRTIEASPSKVSEQDKLSRLILRGNLLFVLATFTGLGLLLAFTPCVLPMVPILSGIIAGQGKDVTTGRAFALSLTYVLGMACTYTLAGAAFAAAGGQIQAALQQTWIIVGVAALFIALALSMFGFYELQIPAAIQGRLTTTGNQQKTGTFLGTALMGALSALVVTTCVAPPLVASLTVIAQAGDISRGALSLFALSIGMGIPLLIIGTSAGKLLPSAGSWMESVKSFFGFLMLGLAIWMLDRILPDVIVMFLWAALAVMAGVWLGAFDRLAPPVETRQRLRKGVGLLMTLYGAALLIGALSGSDDPLRPLQLTGADQQHEGIAFKRIKSVADLNHELQAAASSGKPVMLDFYADWCVSCKEMEKYSFADQGVQAALSDAVLLQADVTNNDDADQALMRQFDIFGPPTIIFFSANGTEKPGYRVVGFMSADEFTVHINEAFSGEGSI